ncbi:MAG: D-alanyl-D-alanine carboxypeptidase [Clostridia bacterium]
MTLRRLLRLPFALLLSISLVFLSTSMGQAQAFDVDARAAILIDASTGQVLYEKNADQPYEPASLVKIMTLLLAMDAVKAGQVSLADPVRTSARAAAIGGSQVYLAEGETHTLEKMLKAIAIASANDASVAVAEYLSGTEAAFVQLMNEKAQSLGMSNSYFANAHGLPVDPGRRPSVASARDMALAARVLVNKHPEVLVWTSTVLETFRENPLFILYNTNGLVGKYDGLDGLKTGHTQAAGWCLVATAQRGNVRLISVVMGTASQAAREEQTRRLLDYGFNRFVPVLAGEGRVGTVKVRTAANEQVDVALAEPLWVHTPRGGSAVLRTEIVPVEGLAAPIAKGQHLGEMVVYLDDEPVVTAPVYAVDDVGRAGLLARAWRSVRDFFLSLLDRRSA